MSRTTKGDHHEHDPHPRVTRLSVAAALTLGLGIVGAGSVLAGTQAWSGRAATTASEEGSHPGAALQSSHHGIHDADPDAGGVDGNITAI